MVTQAVIPMEPTMFPVMIYSNQNTPLIKPHEIPPNDSDLVGSTGPHGGVQWTPRDYFHWFWQTGYTLEDLEYTTSSWPLPDHPSQNSIVIVHHRTLVEAHTATLGGAMSSENMSPISLVSTFNISGWIWHYVRTQREIHEISRFDHRTWMQETQITPFLLICWR